MPYWIPAGLTLLALVLAWLGLSRARGSMLFRAGALAASIGLVLLWVLPLWLLRGESGDWALPLFVGTLFVPVSLLGAGLQAMRYASGGGHDTPADRLFEDLIRHNDLP